MPARAPKLPLATGLRVAELGERLGAKVVSHVCYIPFQMAEVAVPRQPLADILSLIARLRAPPAPA
jgi:hypothetical protein